MTPIASSLLIKYQETIKPSSSSTSSVEAYNSDPDLLIKDYFQSSSSQRAASRKILIFHIKTLESVLAILSWGSTGKVHDGYDGAVNLLAEINNINLLRYVASVAEKVYIPMLQNSSKRNFAENSLEILIKAIACAYQIDAQQRFRLLVNVMPRTNRRVLNSALIDALILMADEIDLNIVKKAIETFTSNEDKYICDYAKDALEDLN